MTLSPCVAVESVCGGLVESEIKEAGFIVKNIFTFIPFASKLLLPLRYCLINNHLGERCHAA